MTVRKYRGANTNSLPGCTFYRKTARVYFGLDAFDEHTLFSVQRQRHAGFAQQSACHSASVVYVERLPVRYETRLVFQGVSPFGGTFV